MTKDTLVYFDFAFWKAEVPRLSYFIAGIDFEDKRLTREEQQKMKASVSPISTVSTAMSVLLEHSRSSASS